MRSYRTYQYNYSITLFVYTSKKKPICPHVGHQVYCSIITTTKLTPQRLILDINKKLLSMNLLLKPSKCRSISICFGLNKLDKLD